MKRSEDFSNSKSDQELVQIIELRAPLSLERSLAELELMIDEVRSSLQRADNYILALEKLLANKETPTKAVEELKKRLNGAKSGLTEIRQDIHEIEDFLSSTIEKQSL